MNWIEGWQAGLVLGAGLTVILNFLVKAALYTLRHRGHGHCGTCNGCIGDNGRAVVPIENLDVCEACGDTFPGKSRVPPCEMCGKTIPHLCVSFEDPENGQLVWRSPENSDEKQLKH